jgi:hypothetical protein
MAPSLFIRSLTGLVLCAWMVPAQAVPGEGVIAVITASGIGQTLKKNDLVLIYKRKKLFFTDGSKALPVNLPTSSPLRREFSRAVLAATPEELEKYWNDMYFHGISPP